MALQARDVFTQFDPTELEDIAQKAAAKLP